LIGAGDRWKGGEVRAQDVLASVAQQVEGSKASTALSSAPAARPPLCSPRMHRRLLPMLSAVSSFVHRPGSAKSMRLPLSRLLPPPAWVSCRQTSSHPCEGKAPAGSQHTSGWHAGRPARSAAQR
jgi:hypothetical protein